jgi:uncharacterized OB-fold protein
MKQLREEAPIRGYQRYLESGKLAFLRCSECGTAIFYPRVLCPPCGSDALEWQTSSGRGTVYATTTVYRKSAAPYNVALVDLEEGFRMMTRVEGVPAEEVEIGARVLLKVSPAGMDEEAPVAVFELVEEDG